MRLQELCLSTIATSIDRYYQAYSATDNADLQLRFQFLQKVYSFQLLSLLNEEDLLQEKYADLVFTKHLKSIDTEWFSKFSWKTVFDTLTKIGPSLENIFFNEDSNDMSWEAIICYLPNIKSITYQVFCNNGILECIAKNCPRLETLDIKRSYDVTDDGLKYFYQKEQGKVPCPLLKEIFLESTLVHDECIKHLVKSLPLLEKIDYSELPEVLHTMHADAFCSLDKVEKYNLIHLSLLNYVHLGNVQSYDEILEICVTVCPKLKSFYCPIFKVEHLSLCSILPDVEDLNLNCVNEISIEINGLLKEKGGKLICLTLRNCSLSLSVLGQSCVRLNQLTMNLVNIQYNENDSIPMFYNLKEFTVENVDLSNSGPCKAICRILASSPALEKLHLKRCKSFTSEMKSKILKCCEECPLKLIDFSGSSVETEFLKDILLTCSTLEALNLDDCNMDIELEDDLYRIAETMPNRPEIIFTDELSYFSDYGELLNDYEDYLDNTDDEDEDDNYLDYDDEYYDDEDHIYYM